MNAILAVKERGCGSAGNKRYYYISFSLSQGKGLATQYPRVVFLKMLIRVLQEEKRGYFGQEGNIIIGREG